MSFEVKVGSGSVSLLKVICAALAVFFLFLLIQTYPHHGAADALEGLGAIGAALAVFIVP
jgi:hypothetical protein